MIVVHWNALPPMTFAYTPITNHSSVKGHMAVMKLLWNDDQGLRHLLGLVRWLSG